MTNKSKTGLEPPRCNNGAVADSLFGELGDDDLDRAPGTDVEIG
jgi:hypothetical protein